MREKAIAIFKVIKEEEVAFPKSALKKAGLNPKSAESWLELIEYVQRQPRIRVIKSKHGVIVEKLTEEEKR